MTNATGSQNGGPKGCVGDEIMAWEHGSQPWESNSTFWDNPHVSLIMVLKVCFASDKTLGSHPGSPRRVGLVAFGSQMEISSPH